VRAFPAAVALLTRVPVRGLPGRPEELSRAVPWFPVVGAAIGLAVAGTFAGGRLILPALVASTLAVGLGAVVTGAFHEDGLADTADALGGGRSREEALRILRDPRLGTFGVTALVLGLVARIASVASLDPWTATGALVAAHALGRAAAVGVLGALPPAAEDGMGTGYGRTVRGQQVGAGLGLGLAAGLAALGLWGLPAAAAASGAAVLMGRLAARRFGGITGDVLGATEQIAEIVVLLVVAGAVSGGWLAGPWWS
jgi:adenosylcobinamide-GDP ribazoletransferase